MKSPASPKSPKSFDLERTSSLLSFRRESSPPHAFLVENRPADTRTHFGSRFVLTKSNPLRLFWTLVINSLLAYTGTVFLYKLCFIDFHIVTELDANNPTEAPGARDAANWASFDNVVAILFWIDLGINFFFSYDEEEVYEVDDLCLIAKNYFKLYFWVNAIACIPDAWIEQLIRSYTQNSPQSINQGARALRLQRMSRLARLTRLTRLAKLRQQRQTAWYQWLERQKGFRIVSWGIVLLLIMHGVACGWYLCAALHEDPANTWVARRKTVPDGTSTLVDSDPFDQWMCAMYFTLTVFTTVGFGDISAITLGETFYVCFAMGVGAIVHSVIISEVINVVVSSDEMQAFVKKQAALVQNFADHTELDFEMSRRLMRWVDATAKQWVAEKYDRQEMKDIVTGKFLPRELLEQLPATLFRGQLLGNNFLWVCRSLCNMPPRLPIIVALALSRSTFSAMEVVYHVHDYSFNLFLVASGTFAYVARPSHNGGIEEVKSKLSRSELSRQSLTQRRPRTSALAKVLNMLSMSKALGEADELPEMTLFPYVLFGYNSYFGDEGLARAAPRVQTARCESEHGELLSLSKVDMNKLVDQFPQFGARWADLAQHHERRNRAQLSKLTFGCTYRHLAAFRIQTWFNELRSGRLLRSRGPGVGGNIADAADLVAKRHFLRKRTGPQPAGLAAMRRDMERLTSSVDGLTKKFGELLTLFKEEVDL